MTRLGAMISIYCKLQNISSRDLAKEIGVSHSTAHRIAQGKNMEMDAFARLMVWLIEEQKP